MVSQTVVVVMVVMFIGVVMAGPMKLYHKADNEKFRHVLVPVSSTVIPLDDLPQYKVGFGVGVAAVPAPGKFRPDGPVKLITIHSLKNKDKAKKDPNAALVEEVSPEEYKKLTQQQHEEQ
ncbi:hypothetical protein Pmani_029432 [Petrolisthes manimaculis]|uniref:Uncharacterized protein n=1 Tax=Petrolisthes manimaculis TaxID=1843537 RepID=A0AAE1TX06_9EUCA|nr:hypothetical protein Pmani_029432 [Petrolisthes manimaculis]